MTERDITVTTDDGTDQVTGICQRNKHGMTLDELGRFVQRAMVAEVPGDTAVRARVSFGGKLQQVHVVTEP